MCGVVVGRINPLTLSLSLLRRRVNNIRFVLSTKGRGKRKAQMWGQIARKCVARWEDCKTRPPIFLKIKIGWPTLIQLLVSFCQSWHFAFLWDWHPPKILSYLRCRMLFSGNQHAEMRTHSLEREKLKGPWHMCVWSCGRKEEEEERRRDKIKSAIDF